MSTTYTDYIHKVAVTMLEEYIDVRTGETHEVTSIVHDQIAYHAENGTLGHLVFSALHHFLHGKQTSQKKIDEILYQLSDIRAMMDQGYTTSIRPTGKTTSVQKKINGVDIKEIDDILEAFGG
ncbi:hypothetical protein [Radiobacillus sp. PE A8.2]|uniref:hypothetical protein n=1 Tax=Radiobacillus sp. PE A8.2 TaxID=3380349 RepID=UPI00388D4B24